MRVVHHRSLLLVTLLLAAAAQPAGAERQKQDARANNRPYDAIIIGSGAAGAVAAAKAARAGRRVLVLERGVGRHDALGNKAPASHAWSSDVDSESSDLDAAIARYASPARTARDPKALKNGAQYYPRVGNPKGTPMEGCEQVGGCPIHHALIHMAPTIPEWDSVAEKVGDPSWRGDVMHRYFTDMEQNHTRNPLVSKMTGNRHGYKGWLPQRMASLKLLFREPMLGRVVLAGVAQQIADVKAGKQGPLKGMRAALSVAGTMISNLTMDPNDYNVLAKGMPDGLYRTPMNMDENGRRWGAPDRLVETREEMPENLEIRGGVTVDKLVYDAKGTPIGVKIAGQEEPIYVREGGKIGVAGGAIHSAAFLQRSGIGDAELLARHGIQVRANLPGVGKGARDRDEVGMVFTMPKKWRTISRIQTRPPKPGEPLDEFWKEWIEHGTGPLATNGVLFGKATRAQATTRWPGAFGFVIPGGQFVGYFPKFAEMALKEILFPNLDDAIRYEMLLGQGEAEAAERLLAEKGWPPKERAAKARDLRERILTGVILGKGEHNSAGTVEITSTDPHAAPKVVLHKFDEGNDPQERDLDEVIHSIGSMRKMMLRTGAMELYPGFQVKGPELRTWVKDRAWGHHFMGSVRMGDLRLDPQAPLDSRFRVRDGKGGVIPNLYVFDASIWPTTVHLFPVVATHMAASKFGDVLLQDLR